MADAAGRRTQRQGMPVINNKRIVHPIMKKSLFAVLATSALMLAMAAPSFAEDKEKETKEPKVVTITGMGTCAKCSLKEATECQNVIQVENKKGKKVSYYLAQNDISKDFHKNICEENKKITATGTVKKVDGKRELTATKIELVK